MAPFGPQLLGTQVLHLPSTSAEQHPLTYTCAHTPDHASILGEQLLQGIVHSYASVIPLTTLLTSAFPVTRQRMFGSCSSDKRCPCFSGCNLRCAKCGGSQPQPSRRRPKASSFHRPTPGVHQHSARARGKVPNGMLEAELCGSPSAGTVAVTASSGRSWATSFIMAMSLLALPARRLVACLPCFFFRSSLSDGGLLTLAPFHSTPPGQHSHVGWVELPLTPLCPPRLSIRLRYRSSFTLPGSRRCFFKSHSFCTDLNNH